MKLSLPLTSSNAVMLYELSIGNNKHLNFEQRGGWGADCSVLQVNNLRAVSTILSQIVEQITI